MLSKLFQVFNLCALAYVYFYAAYSSTYIHMYGYRHLSTRYTGRMRNRSIKRKAQAALSSLPKPAGRFLVTIIVACLPTSDFSLKLKPRVSIFTLMKPMKLCIILMGPWQKCRRHRRRKLHFSTTLKWGADS